MVLLSTAGVIAGSSLSTNCVIGLCSAGSHNYRVVFLIPDHSLARVTDLPSLT